MQDFNNQKEGQEPGMQNGFFRPAENYVGETSNPVDTNVENQSTAGIPAEEEPVVAEVAPPVPEREGVQAEQPATEYQTTIAPGVTEIVQPVLSPESMQEEQTSAGFHAVAGSGDMQETQEVPGMTSTWTGHAGGFQTMQGSRSIQTNESTVNTNWQSGSQNTGYPQSNWGATTTGTSAETQNTTGAYGTYTNYGTLYGQGTSAGSTGWNGGNGYADASAAGTGIYTEHVKKAKKPKKGKGFVALALVITLINMGLFAGAFVIGTQYGRNGRRVTSKQDLVDKIRNGDDQKDVEETPKGEMMDTAEIARTVGPAVVGITSEVEGGEGLFGSLAQSSSEGSGIVFSEDGYIVTNNHVVENSNAVMVTLNTGAEYEAEVVGVDEQTDLAVIKIEPKEELTVATLGDSSKLEVGERVVAIGNPMGLEFFGSVTQGIVSAVNRTISIDNRTMDLIQTDAAINSGNSGGALINAYGEVIGINSVKLASTGVEGMSFAIPISEANPIIADLLEYGYVKGRPIIGVSTRDVSFYMAKIYSWPQGAQVMSVGSDSAREAGLEQGDIITKVNGVEITTGAELNQEKDKYKPGDTLKLEVYKYKNGETETVEVVLSEQIPG